MIKKPLFLLLLCFAYVHSINAQVNFDIQVNRLSDKVALLHGGLGNTNVLVIASESGMVIIDAPYSRDATMCYKKAAIDEFNRNDFIYLINSHADICHIYGNAAFEDIPIIGHEILKTEMLNSKTDTSNGLHISKWISNAKQTIENLEAAMKSFENTEDIPQGMINTKRHVEDLLSEYSNGMDIVAPTISFTESFNLDLGDISIQMDYYGYAHSKGHILIYIPEENILFSGGIFYKDLLPIISINETSPEDIYSEWLRLLKYYTGDETDLKYIIPSHGGTESIYKKEDLIKKRNYLQKLLSDMQRIKNENYTLNMAKKELYFEKAFSEFSNLTNSADIGTEWEIPDIHINNIERLYGFLK